MTKLQIARKRIQEVLAQDSRDFTLPELLWEVNYALDLEEMLSLSTLKKAIAELPEGCIDHRGKHKQTIIHARHFARREEVVTALKALGLYDTDIPVLLKRHEDTLRAALYLGSDGWAFYQSLKWASAGQYEIDHTVYGLMIRWERAA